MNPQSDTLKRQLNNQSDIDKKSVAIVGLFSNPTEKALYACTQKIEKIVAALYLVTDVMDPDLPLTKTLRDRSLNLLSVCFGLFDSAVSPKALARTVVHIEEVASLVGIGRIAHHISDMNAGIIENEFSRVREVIIGEYKILSEKVSSYQPIEIASQAVLEHQVIEDELFDRVSSERKLVHSAQAIRIGMKPAQPAGFKTTIKTTDASSTNHNDVYKQPAPAVQAHKSPIKTTSLSITGNDRKEEILSVIKSHKNASIVDIKKFVTGVSDKTLQRELVKMMDMGLIRRDGNKRWATYSVIP